MPLRTIARITALSPGQSPPPVSTPIRTGATLERQGRIRRLPRSLAIAAGALALGLAGCLGGEERSSRVKGDTVVVYSSLPASGVSASAARAVAAGERMAL